MELLGGDSSFNPQRAAYTLMCVRTKLGPKADGEMIENVSGFGVIYRSPNRQSSVRDFRKKSLRSPLRPLECQDRRCCTWHPVPPTCGAPRTHSRDGLWVGRAVFIGGHEGDARHAIVFDGVTYAVVHRTVSPERTPAPASEIPDAAKKFICNLGPSVRCLPSRASPVVAAMSKTSASTCSEKADPASRAQVRQDRNQPGKPHPQPVRVAFKSLP